MKIVRHIKPLCETDKMRFSFWVKKTPTCWNWQGNVTTSGYGRTNIGGQGDVGAHRVAWVIENGEIPEGKVIDHTCHNKLCVNPSHLNAVTHKENLENYLPVRNSTGLRGVRIHKSGKFYGEVKHNKKIYRTSLVGTVEEANSDVIELRNKLFTNNLLDRVA